MKEPVREICLCSSHWAKFPDGQTERDFNLGVYHIQELVLGYLPHDYSLDGAIKVNLFLGPRGDRVEPYAILDRISEFYIEGFDFVAHAKLALSEQDINALEWMCRGLRDLAELVGSDPHPVTIAQRAVRESGFSLHQRTKLGRRHPKTGVVAEVERVIENREESWWLQACDADGELLDRDPIAVRTHRVFVSGRLVRSYWDGGSFVIVDHAGRETYRWLHSDQKEEVQY